jgi:phosphomannomutase/phosphoglucomutase
VAQFLAGQDRPLSEIVDQLPHYHSTPEIRIPCPDEDKFDVVRQLTEEFKKEYPVVDVDGARVQFQDGWGLVRVSNTQPILVLRFEASTPERLKEIQDVFKNRLAQFKSVDISDL